jgi:thiol-disulfide isomerase/thioredoxin
MAFVHTTCVHCQKASMTFENLYKELGPKGFQPVDIAFNENAPQLVPDFVRQLGLTFPVGTASRDQVLSFLQLSLVQPFSVPQIAIIDRKGMIRAQFVGDDLANLRPQVESLLKEPAGAAKRAPSKARGKATTSARR